MTEAVTEDAPEPAARVADARQAAYFRSVLVEHRRHLDASLTAIRSKLQTREQAGDRFEVHRLRRQIREAEYELNHVEWLIGGLERRYGQAWADLGGEIR